MSRKHLYIIPVLFSFISFTSYAQINCTVPLAPVLTTVSVQPESGKTDFTWLPSESTDIAAYIIYSYKGRDGQAIDTVWDPAATSRTITNMAPKYSSVSYVVAAHRLSVVPGLPGCTSPLSNVLSTIFCEAKVDTCNRKIHVLWSPYTSVPIAVDSYSVMMSVNGTAFAEETTTVADTSVAIDNFVTDANYCFYIRANLRGGLSSTSNKTCVLTRMQRPPDWINADYATVGPDSHISLSFSVDPLSEINHYQVERKSGSEGSFTAVAQLQDVNGSVLYTDQGAEASVINFYRLSAINNCNNPVTVSNIASNIVLSLEMKGNDLNLSWNPYRQWLGMVSDYRFFINTGNGFQEKAVISSTDSTYTLDYRSIMYDVSGDEICMYVSASEVSNPHGITGQSNSSEICTNPIEIITVPNVFTPNNDLINDLFKPVLSFTPKDYHLIISDHHGTVLFETRDFNESWDGSGSGKSQQDPVCLWFLKVTTPSGRNITRTGTVTILMNP